MAIPLALAVPLNYLTCVTAGFWFSQPQGLYMKFLENPWLLLSILQGLFFYVSFSLLAIASQQIGVAVAALFSRLAMVVPVAVSLLFLGDVINVAKFFGIFIALTSLFLLSRNQGRLLIYHPAKFLLIVSSLFSFHGIQLTIMNLAQFYYLTNDQDYHSYMAASFLSALIISSSVYFVRFFCGKIFPQTKHLIAGIILGLCNYACVFYLIKALSAPDWGGSKVFPLFSIGVVGGSALAARICFKEKLSWSQWSGLCLGVIAVSLLNL